MTKERRKYLRQRKKQHLEDQKLVDFLVSNEIVKNPLDLPSLEFALSYKEKHKALFLSTGYDWLDKPHRVAYDAIKEIRTLRKYIADHAL